jgi:hypothetical protein
MPKVQNKEKILNPAKCEPVRITAVFSAET